MPFFSEMLFDGVLSDKEHSKRISAAVRGYGTACARDHDVLKNTVGLHLFNACVDYLPVTSRVGYEYVLCAKVASVTDAVLYIHGENARKIAAVLLGHAHFAALDCDTGLKIKKICAECRKSRATASLVEILKAVYYKGCVNA